MGFSFRAGIPLLGLYGLLSIVPSAAQSNTEWLAIKARCGLSPSLDYNSWVSSGSPCGSSGGGAAPGAPNPLWMLIGRAFGVKQTAAPSTREPDPSLLRAHDLNKNGVAAYNSGDYQTALRDFEQAAHYNSSDPVIQDNLKNARALVDISNKNAQAAASIRSWLQSYTQAMAVSRDSGGLGFDDFGTQHVMPGAGGVCCQGEWVSCPLQLPTSVVPVI